MGVSAKVMHDDRTVLPQAMDYTVDRDAPRLEIELEMRRDAE